MRTDRMYVGGAWVAAGSEERIEVVDPATEEAAAVIPAGVPADVDAAVAAARAAFPGWSSTEPKRRAALLDRAADALAARQDEMARAISRERWAPRFRSRSGSRPGCR